MPKTIDRQQIGRTAEQKAAEFLQKKGLRLLKKNYRCCFGEIDLIMEDRDDIVFVEVRYREAVDHGHPLESIDGRKVKKIIKTATYFLQKTQLLDKKNGRFDVIAIHQTTIEWIRNAFMV